MHLLHHPCSEGGFKENKVSSASVLDVQAASDKKGKPYYKYEILTRTGQAQIPDGDCLYCSYA